MNPDSRSNQNIHYFTKPTIGIFSNSLCRGLVESKLIIRILLSTIETETPTPLKLFVSSETVALIELISFTTSIFPEYVISLFCCWTEFTKKLDKLYEVVLVDINPEVSPF